MKLVPYGTRTLMELVKSASRGENEASRCLAFINVPHPKGADVGTCYVREQCHCRQVGRHCYAPVYFPPGSRGLEIGKMDKLMSAVES